MENKLAARILLQKEEKGPLSQLLKDSNTAFLTKYLEHLKQEINSPRRKQLRITKELIDLLLDEYEDFTVMSSNMYGSIALPDYSLEELVTLKDTPEFACEVPIEVVEHFVQKFRLDITFHESYSGKLVKRLIGYKLFMMKRNQIQGHITRFCAHYYKKDLNQMGKVKKEYKELVHFIFNFLRPLKTG